MICKGCGNEAGASKFCPACGADLREKTAGEAKQSFCAECGERLPAGAKFCPACAHPVSNEKEAAPVKKSGGGKKAIVIALLAVVVIAMGCLIGAEVYRESKAADTRTYEENLYRLFYQTGVGASEAETMGNLTRSVWYNAIWKIQDASTDPYTRPDGRFVDDFNDALANLVSDRSFGGKTQWLMENQQQAADAMKALKNPPEGYEEAYNAAKECFDAYWELTNLVINPTGSYNTFSEALNDRDAAMISKLNALRLYLRG